MFLIIIFLLWYSLCLQPYFVIKYFGIRNCKALCVNGNFYSLKALIFNVNKSKLLCRHTTLRVLFSIERSRRLSPLAIWSRCMTQAFLLYNYSHIRIYLSDVYSIMTITNILFIATKWHFVVCKWGFILCHGHLLHNNVIDIDIWRYIRGLHNHVNLYRRP